MEVKLFFISGVENDYKLNYNVLIETFQLEIQKSSGYLKKELLSYQVVDGFHDNY